MLVSSIFSFSQNAFFLSQNEFQFLSPIYFVVCEIGDKSWNLTNLSFSQYNGTIKDIYHPILMENVTEGAHKDGVDLDLNKRSHSNESVILP